MSKSHQEQRIAIATACGWRFEHVNKDSAYWAEVIKVYSPDGKDYYGWDPKPCKFKSGEKFEYHEQRKREDIAKIPMPDYLNDLNAMAGAEKILTDPQYDQYILFLHHSWSGVLIKHRPSAMRQLISATAEQRAEAFLRTLNAWPQ